MASNTSGSRADRLTHPLLEELGAISAAAEVSSPTAPRSCAANRPMQTVVAAQASGQASMRPRSTSKISTS